MARSKMNKIVPRTVVFLIASGKDWHKNEIMSSMQQRNVQVQVCPNLGLGSLWTFKTAGKYLILNF
jgi:hypothetical protein